jgi:hypothetical protein
MLSGFFLALPERWRSQAVSVFARLDQRPKIKRALVALVSSVSIVIQAAISLPQPKTDDRTGDFDPPAMETAQR